MTTATRNVLEVIQQVTGVPWHYRTNRYTHRRWRYQGPCPTGHDTHTFGFYVSEDQQHWWCFGACGRDGTARDLYHLLTNQTMDCRSPQAARPVHAKSQIVNRKVEDRPRPTGATKAELAKLKGLPLDYLSSLGWKDIRWKSRDSKGEFSVPAILIPYPDQHKRDVQTRYRVSLQGGDTYRWKGGTRIRPYGLWQLEFARQTGYILIDEGETDYVALMSNGIPALGLPGGGSWRPEWAEYLARIPDVYVWQEPRGNEPLHLPTTGERLVQRIVEAVPQLLVIKAPPEAKDPCELAQKLGNGFVKRIYDLMEGAEVPEKAIEWVRQEPNRSDPSRGTVRWLAGQWVRVV